MCYSEIVEFWWITMDALLTFLDYLVSELEYYLEIKRAEQLVEELDHLNAIAFLDEIRASAEYRKL
jgi:peptide deformylase